MLLQKERKKSVLTSSHQIPNDIKLGFDDLYSSIISKYKNGQPIVIDLTHLDTFKCIDVTVSLSTQLFINSVDAHVKFLVSNSQVRKSFNMLNINQKVSCEQQKLFNFLSFVV